jgi:hypothetical protein
VDQDPARPVTDEDAPARGRHGGPPSLGGFLAQASDALIRYLPDLERVHNSLIFSRAGVAQARGA